jgi:glucose-1-phosphate thymidylyltransferase
MKGIVLAGGKGTRLYPLTRAFSKQLLPVYDKPMVYYPIATLMAAGIREILIISTPRDSELFKSLLGDGIQYGVKFSYTTQAKPKGLAHSSIVGAEFIKDENCALILGDNIFHGTGLGGQLAKHKNIEGAHIFGYHVSNPSEYGVLEFNEDGSVRALEEKPDSPKSNFAIPGLYFFDKRVTEIAERIRPSSRGELEIISVLEQYLELHQLNVSILPRGTAWFDTGTIENLHEASNYVRILENRQGTKVACLEEIAWRNGWISDQELLSFQKEYSDSDFKLYFEDILANESSRFLAT